MFLASNCGQLFAAFALIMSFFSRLANMAAGKRLNIGEESDVTEQDDLFVTKRAKLSDFSGRKCCCGDSRCASLQSEMLSFNNSRVGWMTVPKVDSVVPAQVKKRAKHLFLSQRVELFENFINMHPSTIARKVRYLSYVHFHPAVICYWEEQMAANSTAHYKFPDVVPAHCALEANLLHKIGPQGEHANQYFVYHTLTCDVIVEELVRLKFQSSSLTGSVPTGSVSSIPVFTPPPSTASSRRSSLSSISGDNYQLNNAEESMLTEVAKRTPEQTASLLCDMDRVESETRSALAVLQEKLKLLEESERKLKQKLHAHESLFLSRLSLTDDQWHAKHPKAANYLFGFRSWTETKGFLHALFGVESPRSQGEINPASPLTVFEELLVTKMRFRKGYGLQLLGLIWGKGEKAIGRIVRARAPEWGEAGLDLSILDLTPSYVSADLPQEYIDSPTLCRTSGLVDGKCFTMNTFRKDSVLSRAQQNNKVGCSAALSLNWGTPSGLSVEHTAPFLGRASETAVAKLWGSHHGTVPSTDIAVNVDEVCAALCNPRCTSGVKHAPRTEEQKQRRAAGGEPGVDGSVGSIPLQTAHEDVDGGAAEHQLAELSSRLAEVGIGLLDEHSDEALKRAAAATTTTTTTTAPVISATTAPPVPQTSPAAPPLQLLPPAPHVVTSDEDGTDDMMEEALKFFDDRVARADALHETDVTSGDALNAFNLHLLTQDTPNASVSRKLRQLRRQHSLDVLYSEGQLCPSSLSYYLYHTRALRLQLLDYYSSVDRTAVEIPSLPTRLGKFYAGSLILADRGFYYHSILYPNLNGVVTPHFMSGRQKFTTEELRVDQVTTRLRYTSEVAYDRVTMEEALCDEIPVALFPIIHDVHHWAHANINILKPLREPAGWKDYLRIEFPELVLTSAEG